MALKSTLELGDWVHCEGYIKKSGNHYHVFSWKDKQNAATGGYPITNLEPYIDAAIYIDSNGKMSEVEDEHYCERIKFVEHPFDGVFVGVKVVCTMLSCGYEDGDNGTRLVFEKYKPIDAAIVYFQKGKKRLVPLDKLSLLEGGKP